MASRPRHERVVRRRRVVALLALTVAIVVAVAVAAAAGSGSTSSSRLRVVIAGKTVFAAPASQYWSERGVDRGALRAALAQAVPPTAVARASGAEIDYRYDVEATLQRLVAAGPRGGDVEVVRRAVASRIAAPVLRQAQRNTCESAALEILLATVGRRVDQARLQRAFPVSGAPDPAGPEGDWVWGDPDLGYVGRPDGGGSAGGFGVYPGPVRETARRFGAELEDLSGSAPEVIYRRLLEGRAVMVWIGLSDGPYGRWRSPQGRQIEVNFGEHTVVLHGLRSDGLVEVSNPLAGTSETWTKEQFERMWELLGRRALAT